MAELTRPTDDDWRATTTEQYEKVKAYIAAKYGPEAEQEWTDWYARRG